jgi:hypothetical protein
MIVEITSLITHPQRIPMSLITRYFTLIILALSLAFSANGYAEQAAPVNLADYQGVIKLACVGDSITVLLR